MKKLFVGILLYVALISCSPVEQKVDDKYIDGLGVELTTVSYNTSRFIDKEAGVVCWIRGQGISRLPISETKLGNK